MREIRLSGSEGGEARAFPTPISKESIYRKHRMRGACSHASRQNVVRASDGLKKPSKESIDRKHRMRGACSSAQKQSVIRASDDVRKLRSASAYGQPVRRGVFNRRDTAAADTSV